MLKIINFSYTRLEEYVDKIFFDWQLNSEIMASHLISTLQGKYKTLFYSNW